MLTEREFANKVELEINKYLPEDKQAYCYYTDPVDNYLFMAFIIEDGKDILHVTHSAPIVKEYAIPNIGIKLANEFRNKLGLLTIERI